MRTAALVVILLLLAALAVSSFREMRDAAEAAAVTAREDADEAERLARDFRTLQTVPVVAAVTADTEREINQRVETARTAAGLSTAAIGDVRPQRQPAGVVGTDYATRSTQIELAGVTLAEVVAFATALENASEGARVRRLQLAAPLDEAAEPAEAAAAVATSADAAAPERWNAELSLTQTIYSPTVPE